MKTLLFLVIGLVSGITSGLLGVGGGIVMVPAMNLLAGVEIKRAVGTSLAVIIPTAVAGVWKHHKAGNIDWKIAVAISATAIIGAPLGVKLLGLMSPEMLKRGFGCVMIVVGARMLFGR